MTLTDQEIQKRFDFGKELIVKAGELAMSYFNSLETLDIKSKGPQDFVSEADYNTEVLIKDAIKVKFPDDAFFGEETGPTGLDGANGICCATPLAGCRKTDCMCCRPSPLLMKLQSGTRLINAGLAKASRLWC